MLTTELKEEYKTIVNALLHSQTNIKTDLLSSKIKAIDDPLTDLIKFFDRDPELLQYPETWIDVVRVLRFGIFKNSELNNKYDTFVNAYQSLTKIHNPDVDQVKLKEEIGMLMYNIDDFNGIHDRLLGKFLLETAGHIIRAFQRFNNVEDLYVSKIDELSKKNFKQLIAEIIELVNRYQSQTKIGEALNRMIVLIVEPA